MSDRPLDDWIDRLVRSHGIAEVLAALCRHCNERGMTVLFRKLNRVHEWLVDPDAKRNAS